MKLFLASQSPRRRELLKSLGIEFEAYSVDIDETPKASESPAEYVKRLSVEKSATGHERRSLSSDSWVMGSDTTVVSNNQVLGKPVDFADFSRMMRDLSGTQHEVLTSVAVTNGTHTHETTVATSVVFTAINDAQIEAYWKTGEPQDKAGGYGIQGRGSMLVERIEGSFSNVVGLPLRETGLLLLKAGFPIWEGLWAAQ